MGAQLAPRALRAAREPALHARHVGLLHAAAVARRVREQRGHAARRGRRAREQHQPAHQPVQAVHRPQAQPQLALEDGHQRVAVVLPARVHRHRGRLLHHQQVAVVQQHHVARAHVQRGRLVAVRGVRDHVAVQQHQLGRARRAVHADAARADRAQRVVVARRQEVLLVHVQHGPAPPALLGVRLEQVHVGRHEAQREPAELGLGVGHGGGGLAWLWSCDLPPRGR